METTFKFILQVMGLLMIWVIAVGITFKIAGWFFPPDIAGFMTAVFGFISLAAGVMTELDKAL